jgi:hypothetical protein
MTVSQTARKIFCWEEKHKGLGMFGDVLSTDD